MIPLAEPAPGMPGAFYAVLPISKEAAPSHLTPAERALFDALPANGSRRREWLAGRLAGRAALRACGAGATSILRAENGAPRLEGPHADEAHLAITHGRRLAAAIATRKDARWPTVGIDLVDAEDGPRIARIASRFSSDEQRLMNEDPQAALLAWGAREAVAKATRTGMFLFALSEARLEAIDRSTRTLLVNVPGMHLGFAELEGGVLVLAGASAETLAYAAAHVARTQGTKT